MIPERTLKRWRRDTLKASEMFSLEMYDDVASGLAIAYQESAKRVLLMTQELLDLHLIRK